MIPWWLVALLAARRPPLATLTDHQIREQLSAVSARITARSDQLYRTRTNYLDQLKMDETGRLPKTLARARTALLEDLRLYNALLQELRRRAGALELRR